MPSPDLPTYKCAHSLGSDQLEDDADISFNTNKSPFESPSPRCYKVPMTMLGYDKFIQDTTNVEPESKIQQKAKGQASDSKEDELEQVNETQTDIQSEQEVGKGCTSNSS